MRATLEGMQTPRILALAAVLLGACESDLADPWIGGYDVELDESFAPCEGGEARAAELFDTWTLEPLGSGRFAVPGGQCDLTWRAVSSVRATAETRLCTGTTSDGRSVNFQVTSGEMFLDARMGEIWGSFGYRATFSDGACTAGAVSFYGWRF